MYHFIWSESYESYHMDHNLWIIPYGSYYMYFQMKVLINYQTSERAKDMHNGLSAYCGLNC